MAASKKTTAQKIREARLKIYELEDAYAAQLYFETMPECDPTYKYCYTTSNMTIPFQQQDVDAWIRAVIKHMATRREGHGGAYTDAKVVTIPVGFTENQIENWLKYVNKDLRKRALRWKKKTGDVLR